MTATPIPRTLAQTMYADMKVSVLDELPPGRTPIKTFMLSTEHKNKLLPRIMENCQKHLQVYWVCCLVNESDTLEECQDTENARDYLQTNLPDLKIDIVHGQMKAAEKEAAMIKFKKGETDILVATSVIEVGVDVPNAFLIVIENAERYGLAQLHQLRGRVGRGKIESYCCLLCSDSISPAGIERMEVLKESSDGFYIAEKDLELSFSTDLLNSPEYNIKIGTAYYAKLLKKYNGNMGISLAAYNAGIGKVDGWIKDGTIKEDGSDLENIPYKETNNYVRKILRDYNIYKQIYSK